MRRINKKAETIAGIIIGVFILSFVMIGIGTILGNSKNTIYQFEKQMDINLLMMNSYSIINNIDTSNISNGETFYLYKDINNKKFKILTGSTNEKYKFINKYGLFIENTGSYLKNIYTRELKITEIDYFGEPKKIVEVYIKGPLKK